jgi:hypothetical protein
MRQGLHIVMGPTSSLSQASALKLAQINCRSQRLVQTSLIARASESSAGVIQGHSRPTGEVTPFVRCVRL